MLTEERVAEIEREELGEDDDTYSTVGDSELLAIELRELCKAWRELQRIRATGITASLEGVRFGIKNGKLVNLDPIVVYANEARQCVCVKPKREPWTYHTTDHRKDGEYITARCKCGGDFTFKLDNINAVPQEPK